MKSPATQWRKGSSLYPCLSCWSCSTPARDVIDVPQPVRTMVRVGAECEFCGFSWQWSSQPSLRNITAGNLAYSAGILFSGALSAKGLRVLQCMGVATISRRTFYSHQASILFPAIAGVWNRHREMYVRQAVDRGDPLVIGGDGRADSPDLEEGIVIDIQLVQVLHNWSKWTFLTCTSPHVFN